MLARLRKSAQYRGLRLVAVAYRGIVAGLAKSTEHPSAGQGPVRVPAMKSCLYIPRIMATQNRQPHDRNCTQKQA